MAYRADIEIGVRGVRFLDELQNKLTQVSKTIEQVNRQQVVVRRTIAGAASAVPMGPGGAGVTGASAQAAASAVERRVSQMRRDETQAQLKSVKDRAIAENYISGVISRRLQIKQQELATEQKITLEQQKQAAAAFRSQAKNVASNAIIGGAFPLLFGQGAGAALGGGLGGALGGAFGGTLGFGLSLVGTAIGQAVDDAKQLNRELTALNNNLSSTGRSSQTTAADVSQLASQLGIAKDEALKLVGAFSEFDSAGVREALAASFGAVGGEEAFNALAAAIDNKSTLEAIVKLRDTITDKQAKEALKQLEINGAAAANAFLQERLIQLQEQKLIKVAQEVTLLDRLLAAAASLGAQGQFIDPAIFGQERADKIRAGAAERKKAQAQALQDTKNFLSEVSRLNEQFTTKTKTGAKPPEDRTASLRADLQAIIEIGNAEDLIRDLRFAGRDLLVVDVELSKALADIERDRIKQLEQANYETERSVINQIAKVRALNEERKTADKVREINNQRFQDELDSQQAVRDAVKPFTDLAKQQQLQTQYSQTYLRLVTEGMLPAEAERIANFEKLVKEQLSAKEEQIAITELAILEAKAREASTVELEKQLRTFKAQQDAIKGEAAKGPGAGRTNRERLQDEIAIVQGELNTLLDPINQVKVAAEGIGLAFSDSFKGIVSGTMTAQEALAGFFQSVADQFLDMAAQIIAKWIQLTILNSILRLFPATGAAGGSAELFGAGAPDAIAGGGIFSGAGPYQFRANGGPVSAGSPYIVGEKGPELFVPGKSGTIVPNNKLGSSGSSNVVVNVDASGSKVQGDDTKASQLGSALAAAVQAEIIKQKKPGGLLY